MLEATAAPAEQSPAPAPSETPAAAPSPAAGSTAEAAPAPAAPPSSPDWRDGLDGDDLEFAKRFASKADFVKGVRDLRKLASLPRVPGKDAKPEDIAAYRKAIGAPETPEGYDLPFTEGNEPEKALAVRVKEVLHKYNAPASMAGELHGVVKEIAEGIDAENERLAVKGRKDAEASLRLELGADFDGHIALAQRAADAFGGAGFKNFLNTTMVNGVKLGDHPEFLKVFGTIGRRMGESNFIGAVGKEERTSLHDTIMAKTRQMQDAMAKGDRMGAASLNREVMELSAKLDGTEPIVGRGRAL